MESSFKTTKKYFSSSPEVSKVKEILEYKWKELRLSHFNQVMDYVECLSLYFEQLPKPEISYIALMIMSCHTLASDKFIAAGIDIKHIDNQYFELLSSYLNENEIAYYLRLYKTWVASCGEAKEIKNNDIPDTPVIKQFIWSNWRSRNIGMCDLMKLIIMVNFPNVIDNLSLVHSSIVYISLQCALMNDIGSIKKDKSSSEVNYYIEIDSNITSQRSLVDESDEYLNSININDNIKQILKSSIHGSYLLYHLSERYFGRSDPNW